MIAVGLALSIFGTIAGCNTGVAPPGRYDWRDLFATFPLVLGMILVAAGVIKWLWLVAP